MYIIHVSVYKNGILCILSNVVLCKNVVCLLSKLFDFLYHQPSSTFSLLTLKIIFSKNVRFFHFPNPKNNQKHFWIIFAHKYQLVDSNTCTQKAIRVQGCK